MAAIAFHFYEKTFNRLDATLATYIGDTATGVIAAISGVAYSMMAIYMALYGWSVLRGMVSEPISDFTARIIRISLIVSVSLNLGRYNTYVSDFLWSTGDAMASLVASGETPLKNVQYLDVLFSKVFELGDAYWQKGNAAVGLIPDLGLLATAWIIWVAGVAATAYGAFLLALSKMALAIILGIGPIFILLLLFDSTKRFFDAWLGQALNYVFLTVLTAGGIKLILTIIELYLDASTVLAAKNATVDLAIPCIVLCLIAALVLMQIPSTASALGGGVAISTLGAAAWAYGKAKGAAASLRPTSLRREFNRAASDVRIAAGAVGKVAGAPMAVYRRITGAGSNRVSKR